MMPVGALEWIDRAIHCQNIMTFVSIEATTLPSSKVSMYVLGRIYIIVLIALAGIDIDHHYSRHHTVIPHRISSILFDDDQPKQKREEENRTSHQAKKKRRSRQQPREKIAGASFFLSLQHRRATTSNNKPTLRSLSPKTLAKLWLTLVQGIPIVGVL